MTETMFVGMFVGTIMFTLGILIGASNGRGDSAFNGARSSYGPLGGGYVPCGGVMPTKGMPDGQVPEKGKEGA